MKYIPRVRIDAPMYGRLSREELSMFGPASLAKLPSIGELPRNEGNPQKLSPRMLSVSDMLVEKSALGASRDGARRHPDRSGAHHLGVRSKAAPY